jgi:predicted RNA polymerase sigma factor
MTQAIRGELEKTVRTSYGKILAILSSRYRDIAACEDALGDALRKALQSWPSQGIPANPEGWLVAVARNQLIDEGRRHARLLQILASPELTNPDPQALGRDYPDERIKLLFVCTHPTIDEAIRTPLMLQTVFGMDTAEVASAFLLSKDSMAKRLSRAKAKIRDFKISFEVPDPKEAAERIDSICECIFAAYGKGWDLYEKDQVSDFDEEAIYLARLLTRMLASEAECWGLLAVLLSCEARKSARMRANGVFVPLDQQSPQLWDQDKLIESEESLRRAFSLGKIGRFQLEAAIQSAHNARVARKINNWPDIVGLYDGLLHYAPTVGAALGRCAALAELYGASYGWQQLKAQFTEEMKTYLPYWALRAHLLSRLEKWESSLEAYTLAIGLCENYSMRRYLDQQKRDLLLRMAKSQT